QGSMTPTARKSDKDKKMVSVVDKGEYDDVYRDMEYNGALQKLSLMRNTKYTPDFPTLKKTDLHPIFLYDSLQPGKRGHNIVKESPVLGSALSMQSFWTLKTWGFDTQRVVMFRNYGVSGMTK